MVGSLFVVGAVLAQGSFATAQVGKQLGSGNKSERQQMLETIGGLSAGHVYQSFLNIGLLADGKAQGTYEDKAALEVLRSVSSLMDTLDRQLDRISKLELAQADRDTIAQVRKASTLLRQQAGELEAFWKTGDKSRSTNYEKLRQEAWQAISKLLGP
jgi:hypothetical protein